MLFLARTRFRSSPSWQTQPLHSRLTTHHLHFYASNWRESNLSKKKDRKEKKEVFPGLHFLKQLPEVIVVIYFSQHSMIREHRAWRGAVVTALARNKCPASVYLYVLTVRLVTCQLTASVKWRRKRNCRPLSVALQTVSLFTSPEHLRLIFIYFCVALTRLFNSECFFFNLLLICFDIRPHSQRSHLQSPSPFN